MNSNDHAGTNFLSRLISRLLRDPDYLNNKVAELIVEGDYDKAMRLAQEALKKAEKAGSDHPDVATSLHNLGRLYARDMESMAAESAYRRAIEIREKSLDPDDPQVAETLAARGKSHF